MKNLSEKRMKMKMITTTDSGSGRRMFEGQFTLNPEFSNPGQNFEWT
jgi:hypothetical protein